MKQEFIHKVNMDNILLGPSISKHDKPKKLMVMLHGYGDNAANFIHLAEPLDQDEWGMHYVALNAPSIMPGNPMGYQWFDLYLNGVYISDVGPKEFENVRNLINENVKKISNTISLLTNDLNIDMSDCFVMGFSQGGIMAFELGQSLNQKLAGIAIISSRIISREFVPKNSFLETPIFISHGGLDNVLPVSNFNQSVEILKNYNFKFESHLLPNDEHTMSQETITLFQNFIKKNI